MTNIKEWTVWIGGTEATDYYLDKAEAEKLANKYKSEGYDDVKIEKWRNNND
tara:strand:+ start:2129 stop:2284 length:156 start_codon:yes stop_codon:yes gene_type:complete